MSFRIEVVLDVAFFTREYRVVPAHPAVVAGEPMRASLAEDDIARHDILLAGLFGAKAFARTVFGAVGAALCCVRSVSDCGSVESDWDGCKGGRESEKVKRTYRHGSWVADGVEDSPRMGL